MLFSKKNHSSISELTHTFSITYTPLAPTTLAQLDSTTYDFDSISISWVAPVDSGCSTIIDYKIEGSVDNSTFEELTTGITATQGTASDNGNNIIRGG